ncbi:MAG TPA: sugar phosphate nucleotidyltransferase [Nitrospiraceae bacterium]|jgi:glucose-1-phosphate cytidylyltransferase
MKVVLFCGGLGMRMREYSEAIPKPMVPIGYRPILWHVMRYYAHYGHKDFILCLGYKADSIKSYFLDYNECVSNDFVLSNGGKNVELLSSDIHDWNITFCDTGLMSNIGQRLKAVQRHLQGEEMFLANYTDALSDVPIPQVIESFKHSDKVACFVSVRPRASFHMIETGPGGIVSSIEHIGKSGFRMNGGYMVLRPEIFDYMQEGEELVEEPFRRLISDRKLLAYSHDGYWVCMDTFKEKQDLDDVFSSGNAPWAVWHNSNGSKEWEARKSSAYSAVGSVSKELL